MHSKMTATLPYTFAMNSHLIMVDIYWNTFILQSHSNTNDHLYPYGKYN